MEVRRPFKDKPDFNGLLNAIRRKNAGKAVPLIELDINPDIMADVLGADFPSDRFRTMDLGPEATHEDLDVAVRFTNLSMEFYPATGYDYVLTSAVVPLLRTRSNQKEHNGNLRTWREEHKGIITSFRELEEYKWPDPEQVNLISLDYLGSMIPDGMKLIVFYMGIFEDLSTLMGFETMAIKSIREPELPDTILERLTVIAEDAVDKIAAHPAVGAVFYADDMGFNTGTMLSPGFMREKVIPRQKRIADACRRHGKPFLLHSCGKIDAIMEDLIETVGIDAYHGLQHNIEPIENAYARYGDRIAIFGGVDVDLLARGSEEQVRARVRQLLDTCGPGGGFCIGSNNAITNYCKLENYYAMIDELRIWNETNI